MAEELNGTVFMADPESYACGGGILRSLDQVLEQSGFRSLFKPKQYVAIKVSIGELGNTRYLRPVLIRSVVEKVLEAGGIPVVTDTVGMVGNALRAPADWFYKSSVMGYPGVMLGKEVIPADGYSGEEGELLPVDGEQLGGLEVARGLIETSAVIILSHVTGHPFFGLNGALFNQGAGCAAQRGKWRIYSPLKPVVDAAHCDNCGRCQHLCPNDAVIQANGSVRIDPERCKGCNHYCLKFCPQGALSVDREAKTSFQKRVVEAATAVNVATLGKLFYLNFLLDIGRYPDYYTLTDQNVAPDLGILAGRDPVAIDQLSLELIDKAPGFIFHGNEAVPLEQNKFERIHGVDPYYPLHYAEEYGLGLRRYNLQRIGG